jgi:outer membrane protein, multidrug efflux system
MILRLHEARALPAARVYRATAGCARRLATWRAIAVLASISIAGCAVTPSYRPPTASELAVPDRYASLAQMGEADIVRWWQLFDDPDLTNLIERAVANNFDIQQSAARLKQARESCVQTGAAQLPSVNASGRTGRLFNGDAAPDSSSFSAGIDASWTVDLFGGLHQSREAARASLESAGYSLASVRVATAAELARNYVDARTYEMRIAIARNTLKTYEENLEIATFRAQAGLVSSLDVEQAISVRAQTAASIPSLTSLAAQSRYRVAVLTGQVPGAVDALFREAAKIPECRAQIAIGIPADTLRRRPDVRASERSLAAATARIGVAEADLYPQLTLSGNLSTSSSTFRSLTDIVTGNLFASISQFIFDGGRRASVVASRRAAAEEAVAAYKSSVLTALEDADKALQAVQSSNDRARELRVAVQAANAAAILARSRYRSGLTDFQALLQSEQSLLSALDNLASAQGSQATSLIQLYLALGGGWDPSVSPAEQTAYLPNTDSNANAVPISRQ